MTSERMGATPVRLLAIVALAAFVAIFTLHRQAQAVGVLYFSAATAPADGVTPIVVTYVGDTTGIPDALGNTIRISVAPAAGSTAVPRFTDGTTTTNVTLVGSACDANQHPPVGTVVTTCYTSVAFNSSAAGDVTVTAQNVTSGGAIVTGTRSFYGAPSATGPNGVAQSGPLNLAGAGDLGATTPARISSGAAFAGLLTLDTPFRDAGGRAVTNAPVTCVTTLGTFLENGTSAVTGLTTALGQLPTMNLMLSALQVTIPTPGTISCTVNAVTGSLTVTGLFATVGAPSQLVITTDKPVVSGVTGSNDTITVSVTVKDSANNGVTGLATNGGLTVTVSPSTAGALGTLAGSTTTPGLYTVTYTPISTAAGNAFDAVTLTAHLSAQGANITQTTTFVQSGPAATMTLAGSLGTVQPNGYVILTTTLKDSAGHTVATAGAPTITFTSTGVGNLLIPASATTALNGVATGVFIAGQTPGPVTVTATSSNGLGAFRTITIAAAPTTPPTPTQQVVAATATGTFCFVYVGPSKAIADFATFFATGIVAVNQMSFPAGSFNSWFRAAPTFATITQLSNGDVLCVTGTAGSNVFSASATS